MSDIPETLGDDRIDQCWEDFTSNLKRERDEARRDVLKMSTLATEYADSASKWQQCAERLAVSIAWSPLVPTKSMEAALAEFERLKEETK